MPFSPADSQIFAPLFSDSRIAELFNDEQFTRALLRVEAVLAEVQSELGIIPAEAGERIARAAAGLRVDYERLCEGTEQAGVPTISLVAQLREATRGGASSYVHWGATSQDIMDTALVLQIRSALAEMEPTLARLIEHLARLADRHRATLMAGRTHSQQALPIPFGLKVAGWLAPLLRHKERLAELKPRLLVVQFGGAAGTLAALDREGTRVQEALAAALELGIPPMPWHTQRDNLAELAGWLSLVSGSLAKMAQDIILMAQSEVAEVRESDDSERGGSSTMPQKNNPIVSELIIAAARTNATLLSAMHQSLVQEHERGTHGWQMEWLNLPPMIALTSSALSKALFLSEHLVVDEERMRQNVESSNGLMLAEAITFALTATMDRSEAKEIVTQASRVATATGQDLIEVVRKRTSAHLDWEALRDEAAYFGSADAFIERVLDAANEL